MARVEATGFSGGIWCLWKRNQMAMEVVSTSSYCILLKVINPKADNAWLLLVIYGSPQARLGENLPWYVIGNFNTVLYEHEKLGGAPVNRYSCDKFAQCIEECNLVENCGIWIRLETHREENLQRYFKFLGPWLQHPDFHEQVRNAWRDGDSWMENMKRLTNDLRAWNKDCFGNMSRRNTHFFHQTKLIRRRGNKIDALLDDNGVWIHEENTIRSLLVCFYQRLYSTSGPRTQALATVSTYPPMSSDDLAMMSAQVSMEEVRKALFSMGNYKAPGPDGFHPLFFKAKWEILGPSIYNFVTDVFSNPALISMVNQTTLTLIPKAKGNDPSHASDFRPIALCNVIYKIVTKVIANRIKGILPKLISLNQSSFISGRSTFDNSIVLQEIVHSLSYMTGKKGYMVVKLDLQKAYDKMEWSFVLQSMELLGIPPNLISIIQSCLSTINMCINWYGRHSNNFSTSCGLRQGDPLSPYLFVIALERLSHSISDAVNDGLWCPLKIGLGGPSISHLMFADDILLVAEATDQQANHIKQILDVFCSCSGQRVNFNKSKIFYSRNVAPNMASMICSTLGVEETKDLERYLGFPIIVGRKSKAAYSFIIDKVQSKLTGRKARSLSLAGRVTLAQNVIMSMPNYVMQTCCIPASICDKVERLCRNFIWGTTSEARRCHLLSWDTICRPKEEGGLGFRSLRMVNICYMLKLGWNLVVNQDALWVRVMRSKYDCGGLMLPNVRCGSRASHIWREIARSWNLVEQSVAWVVRNGQTVRFWQDRWVHGLGHLSDLAAEIPSDEWDFLVSDYVAEAEWNWTKLKQLLPADKIASIKPPCQGAEDFPVWSHSKDGFFTIKTAYQFLYADNINREPPI